MAADGRGRRARGRHAGAGSVALAAALVGLAGCTSQDSASQPVASASVLGPAAAEGRDPTPAPPTSPPPTAAGSLDGSVMPTPQELGAGWEYRIEGGELEEGTGNETPFQQRDPAEMVLATIPMGCEQHGDTATPNEVLQATYQHAGTGEYAVVLRMRFGDAAAATQFSAGREADLTACRDQPDDPYSGTPAPVLAVSTDGGRVTARYELIGEPGTWTTIAGVAGSDLITLDTDADPGGLTWLPPGG